MNSIIITPKNEKERSFIMEMLKKMRIKAELVNEEDMQRMTIDEYNDMIDQSLADARKGRTISHEEFGKKIEKWH